MLHFMHLLNYTIGVFIFGLSISTQVIAKDDDREAWEGCYISRSALCTTPDTGEDCSGEFKDTLRITQADKGYLIDLYSTQANYHVCAFSMHMDLVGGSLVGKTPSGDLRLEINNRALEIFSKGIDPTASGLGVCGAYADINGLQFPINSKIQTGCDLAR